MLKRISETLPLITVGIIVLGILNQIIYYNNFNLPIKYFIGISELGLIIADNLIIYCTGAFLLFLILLAHDPSTFYPNLKNEKKVATIDTMNKFEKKFKRGLIIIFLIFIGVFAANYFFRDSPEKDIQDYFIILYILILFFIFYNTRILGKLIGLKTFFSIIVLIFLIFILSFETVDEIKKVESGKYTGTIITTNEGSDTSTSTRYFIGKTEKYVFIYNKKDVSVSIIPTESIKKLLLKVN